MSLTPPTADQLLEHMQQDSFDAGIEDVWVTDVLQQATDIMYIATNLTADPTDPVVLRIIQTGMLAMAYALLVQSPDRPAIYSPFTSEHIGSYSYTREATNMVSQVASGSLTGVPWFDLAVRFFNSLVDPNDPTSGAIALTAEDVFIPDYHAYEESIGFSLLPGFAPDIFNAPDSSSGFNPGFE